jgi:hypothetical protein
MLFVIIILFICKRQYTIIMNEGIKKNNGKEKYSTKQPPQRTKVEKSNNRLTACCVWRVEAWTYSYSYQKKKQSTNKNHY